MNNTDWIEAYFDDALSPEEVILFEKKIKEDPEFNKQVEFRRQIEKQLKEAADYQRTKTNIESILSEKKAIPFSSKTLWAIAASVVILVSLYALFGLERQNNNLVDDENPTKEEYHKPEMIETPQKADLYQLNDVDRIKFKPEYVIYISDEEKEIVYSDKEGQSITKKGLVLSILTSDTSSIELIYHGASTPQTGYYIYLHDTLINALENWELKSTNDNNLIYLDKTNLKIYNNPQ